MATNVARAVPSSVPAVPWGEREHRSHVVQFYAEDEFLVDALARFVGTALGAGDAAIVIATKAHREALARQLRSNGLDTSRTVRQGRFVVLDAAETLSKFMLDGMPDEDLFTSVVGTIVSDAIFSVDLPAPRVAAFGEMVALLWADGNHDAAIRLEQFWNNLAKRYAFSLHCAYPIAGFCRDEHNESFAQICAEHSSVLPHENYSMLENEEARLREVAYLQQRESVHQALKQTKATLEEEIVERIKVENRLRESESSLRELSGHLLRMQDEERRRLGRELHDSLGQYLAALKMSLESLQADAGTPETAANKQIGQCIALADQSMREVRTISYLLYPPMLEEMGLRTAVPWYLEGFAKRSGIQTSLNIAPMLERLPRDVELALFRVLQESLTNVHRHSQSTAVNISLSAVDEGVVLEIRDNGTGISPAILEPRAEAAVGVMGVGLRGMQERMQQLGGKLDLSSVENGTVVRAVVPLSALKNGSSDSSVCR